jgi:glycosyltransferase involved in cell wall biosynthesis
MPEVSVLLPCYNAAPTLEEALASLQAQTLSDFEAICVDDGSTDATPAILEAWSKNDRRFVVVKQEHSGVIQAANLGLSLCRAPLVARMDADDRCFPERLERQRDYLREHPETTVVGSLVGGFPEEGVGEGFQLYYHWLNSLVSHQEIIGEIFAESPLANPSAAFRADRVRDAGGWQDHGWPEDYDLWLRLFLAGAGFAKVPEVLLEWREHPGRLTHQDPRYSVENFLRAKAHYLARGPARGRDAVFIWGAGMTGRRLSKLLAREGLPLAAYLEVDQEKIGRTQRGLPIIDVEELPVWWGRYQNPLLLIAVRALAAVPLIRARMEDLSLVEGRDWWRAA